MKVKTCLTKCTNVCCKKHLAFKDEKKKNEKFETSRIPANCKFKNSIE